MVAKVPEFFVKVVSWVPPCWRRLRTWYWRRRLTEEQVTSLVVGMVEPRVRTLRKEFDRSMGKAMQDLVSRGLASSSLLASQFSASWEAFAEATAREYLGAYRQVLFGAKSSLSVAETENLLVRIAPILDDSAAQGETLLKNYSRPPQVSGAFEDRLNRFYVRLRHDLRQELGVEMQKDRLGIGVKKAGDNQ